MDLAPLARQRFFDSNGVPLAGGQLYTYQAGTNTPKATYADYTGTTPNANPVVLDSQGYADIWIGTGYWKFVLEDANGNILWTKDHVGLPSTAAQSPPAGGSTGQVLIKNSNADYDYSWGATLRAAAVGILGSAQTVTIAFSSPMPNTNYSVVWSMQCPDSSPIFLQGTITAKTATGFTINFNAPTDSANYILNYIAMGTV